MRWIKVKPFVFILGSFLFLVWIIRFLYRSLLAYGFNKFPVFSVRPEGSMSRDIDGAAISRWLIFYDLSSLISFLIAILVGVLILVISKMKFRKEFWWAVLLVAVVHEVVVLWYVIMRHQQ